MRALFPFEDMDAFETVEEGESLFNELLFPYGYGQLD